LLDEEAERELEVESQTQTQEGAQSGAVGQDPELRENIAPEHGVVEEQVDARSPARQGPESALGPPALSRSAEQLHFEQEPGQGQDQTSQGEALAGESNASAPDESQEQATVPGQSELASGEVGANGEAFQNASAHETPAQSQGLEDVARGSGQHSEEFGSGEENSAVPEREEGLVQELAPREEADNGEQGADLRTRQETCQEEVGSREDHSGAGPAANSAQSQERAGCFVS